MAKDKKGCNHFGELKITTDAPFVNLPLPRKDANKGPTTPIGQQPRKIK